MLTVEETCEIIKSQLGGSLPANVELNGDTVFDDLGLSSLQISDIVFSLEERLGTEFDAANAAEVKTIGQLVELANRTADAPVN